MENYSEREANIFNDQPKIALPNATAVLVLGIVSIVTCFCYGILWIICSVIALVLSSKDNALYVREPNRFLPSSYSNLKAGRVCAIIGLIMSIMYLIMIIGFISYFGLDAMRHGDWYKQMHQ